MGHNGGAPPAAKEKARQERAFVEARVDSLGLRRASRPAMLHQMVAAPIGQTPVGRGAVLKGESERLDVRADCEMRFYIGFPSKDAGWPRFRAIRFRTRAALATAGKPR